jgi:hypothetical protein
MTDRVPDTVTEAVTELEDAGYTSPFLQRGAELVCLACGTPHPLLVGVVDAFYRFEGPSDPGDEAIVLGVRCGECGARGTLVSAFGPDADPDAFEHLARISAEAAGRRLTPPSSGDPA